MVTKLYGSSNWRDFKDKLFLKLSTMEGKRGVSLKVITDKMERGTTSSDAVMNISDDIDNMYCVDGANFTTGSLTYFGYCYKSDNTKVLTLINTSEHPIVQSHFNNIK